MKKLLIICSVLLLASQMSYAGGPISVAENGTAAKWDGTIPLHPESGTCGTFTNPQMLTKIAENVGEWEDVSDVDLTFTIADGVINEDVTDSNYEDFFVDSSGDAGLTDSINPVVFDDDGMIVRDIFGSGSQFSVLGFAGPDGFSGDFTEIRDGQAFFNCRCLAGNESCGGVLFTEDDLNFTMTHEIGHMIGLDHTQVNQAIAEEDCDLNVAGDCDDIPTMYPQSVDAADQITPHRDDEVALQVLYGLSDLTSSTYTVTGSLVDADGNPLRCADIQAETGDTADTIAVVSGVYAENSDLDSDGYTDGDGECLDNCGDFILRGLDPTKTYTITVKPIDSQWTGGSSVSPCGNGQISGITEQLLTTVNAGVQAAGTTLALGLETTTSTGGTTTGTDDGDGGSAASGGGCDLSGESVNHSGWLVIGLGALFVCLIRRSKCCLTTFKN